MDGVSTYPGRDVSHNIFLLLTIVAAAAAVVVVAVVGSIGTHTLVGTRRQHRSPSKEKGFTDL